MKLKLVFFLGYALSLLPLHATSEPAETIKIENPYLIFFKGVPGAGYMQISHTFKHPLKLIKVQWADQSIFSKISSIILSNSPKIEMHDHIHKEGPQGQDITEMVRTPQKDGISIAPDQVVQFIKGGKHLMLYNLQENALKKKQLKLKLTFEKRDQTTFEHVEVFFVKDKDYDPSKESCSCHDNDDKKAASAA